MSAPENTGSNFTARLLNSVERVGNKLPDPALLFVFALAATWIASLLLDGTTFRPAGSPVDLKVANQLTGDALATFFSQMVETFTGFHPLGVVLVALLGVGVAEEAGFINVGIKKLLGITSKKLLTPMLILVALVSHTAADAGYVLVIPLGGVLFYAAGRHPLAGIAAAFAGVSGGFGANFLISGIDPLLQGITQAAAGLTDPTREVNPLCNWWFTAASSLLIILVGWFLTEKVVEPRLRSVPIDGDPSGMPEMTEVTPAENRGFWAAMGSLLVAGAILTLLLVPEDSALRSKPSEILRLTDGRVVEGIRELDATAVAKSVLTATVNLGKAEVTPGRLLLLQTHDGLKTFRLDGANAVAVSSTLSPADATKAILFKETRRGGGTHLIAESEIARSEPKPGSLTSFSAPIMQMIVPLIFVFFLLPGIVHGYVSGRFKSHRDVVKGMSRSMGTMSYYLVMAFFAALFIYAFGKSNIGSLIAVRGAEIIQSSGLPAPVTVVGIIGLCAVVNLLVGSASAKWALLAPIFVPMLMQLGISPELTQAAYRVGDSTTNIITPLMPYFPLVVTFCQRYHKGTGIGTVVSLMLPYTVALFVTWTLFLLAFWGLGIPLGIQGGYTYPN